MLRMRERLSAERMNFSTRTNWNLVEHELAAAVRRRRAAKLKLADLTVSNPTHCGFAYDAASILAPLHHADAAGYEPDPLGMMKARQAVSDYYREAGANVAPEQICLTTSTSEAYSFLFRLLCNPGDEVLAARPSYPLFDYIARLDDVELREYPLFHDPNAAHAMRSDTGDDPSSDAGIDAGQGWSIDLHGLRSAITDRTRAILVVHPNNPTGNYVSAGEREALQAICAQRGLALIVDEVFRDYPLEIASPSFTNSQATQPGCLTFVLSGLSKVCGLPQMKASWIVACGPADLLHGAMERIEVIADTFLSMNAPIQHAMPAWLAARHGLQDQIRQRMLRNLESLDRRLRGSYAQRLAMQGGWTAVLRVPRTVGDQDFSLAALERGVLVQPGEFYGMGHGRVVLSLLTPPGRWDEGLERLPID